MKFPKKLIDTVVREVEWAEEATITDYGKSNITQEDIITSRLAARIQDRTNDRLGNSKLGKEWSCVVKELSNKGANSLEKKFGFDLAISINNGPFIKTLLIQNKMGGKTSDPKRLKKQIQDMSKLSPDDKGYVGVIESDGIYLTSGVRLESHGHTNLHTMKAKDMLRIGQLVKLFLECKVGEIGLDLNKLNEFNFKVVNSKRLMQEPTKNPLVVEFTKISGTI